MMIFDSCEVLVGGDSAGGFDPVGVGHADVHEDYVGSMLAGHGDGGGAVGGFADHFDVCLGVEQGPEAGADVSALTTRRAVATRAGSYRCWEQSSHRRRGTLLAR